MNHALRRLIASLHIDPIGVAMPGPRLPRRVRSIIEEHGSVRLSRARNASLVVACAIICAAFFAVTLTRAQSSGAQDWEKAAGGNQSFDAASVKQNKAGLPPAGPPMRVNVPLSDNDAFRPT